MIRFVLSKTVRHGGKSYGPGQERDLVALLSDDQKADFLARGLLVGVPVEGVALDGTSGEAEAFRTEALKLQSALVEQNRRLEAVVTALDEAGFEVSTGENPLETLERYAVALRATA